MWQCSHIFLVLLMYRKQQRDTCNTWLDLLCQRAVGMAVAILIRSYQRGQGRRSDQRWEITKTFWGRHPACDQTPSWRAEPSVMGQWEWQQGRSSCFALEPILYNMDVWRFSAERCSSLYLERNLIRKKFVVVGSVLSRGFCLRLSGLEFSFLSVSLFVCSFPTSALFCCPLIRHIGAAWSPAVAASR